MISYLLYSGSLLSSEVGVNIVILNEYCRILIASVIASFPFISI